jgi:hypothetical protein
LINRLEKETTALFGGYPDRAEHDQITLHFIGLSDPRRMPVAASNPSCVYPPFANQCQTGLVAQVAGQWFDDEIGHGLFAFWVKQHARSKLFISIEKMGFFDCQVTDSGSRHADRVGTCQLNSWITIF